MDITAEEKLEIENKLRKFLKEEDVTIFTALCIQCNFMTFLLQNKKFREFLKSICNDCATRQSKEDEHILENMNFIFKMTQPFIEKYNKISEAQE